MTDVGRPADFDAYWDGVDEELARYPMAVEMERNALRSSEFSTVYNVRLTSIGPYRIFGYYSVPIGDGPFPGADERDHATGASTMCPTTTTASGTRRSR